uniref:Glutathione peroxidase n=1 Tax=Phaffia rhodozyma TaxID=264483 RepID=A0A0D4CFL5_PHARH|nr:glutathione peroxidase [Phaffia rhodozyma]
MSSFYALTTTLRKGKALSFDQFKGKTILIVNVASKCGKTPQYKVLQELYTKYHDQGLELIGFPSNQFKEQEPGTDDEIAQFCELNYGVSFPIVSKSNVNGPETNDVYKYLKEKKAVENISWNFDKFLVDKEGNVVEYFDRSTTTDVLEPTIRKYL